MASYYFSTLYTWRKVVGIVILFFFLGGIQNVMAQPRFSDQAKTVGFMHKTVYEKKGYTLIFINKSREFDSVIKQRLVQTFFKVYPREARKFNRKAIRQVTFVIDPDYKGVAATSGATVRYNLQWFKSHPEDIDVVTHEAMHIVQAYHSGFKPGWLVEGIADYVRYVFGINNKAAGWTLPDYNAKQSYKNAYRITARFLVWMNNHYGKSIVKKLDAALRDGQYKTELWKQLTGRSLDGLWQEYGTAPAVNLRYN